MTRDEPFRSQAERARERALEARYHEIGNSALVAALRQQRAAATAKEPQRPARLPLRQA